MKEKLKVGIIGAGSIGHCHVDGYKKNTQIELVAVCDINKERADTFAARYKIPKVYENHNEMLENCELDAISVCTWNNVHASISIDALNRGIHVLCEKPMALNTQQALKMKQAAENNALVLMPGFCTRYEDGVRLLKQYVEKNRLGDIYYVKATYLRRRGNPGGWFSDLKRSGGGPIIDLGVHVLDLARYVVGGNTVSVSAITNKMPQKTIETVTNSPHVSIDEGDIHDVEDFASALIRMDNGTAIQFETSWNHHLEQDSFQLEVYGNAGGAKAYPKVSIYMDDEGNMCALNADHTNHEDMPNYDFDKETEHFIRVVQGKEQAICTAEDGVEVMRMVDAIYESAKTGHEILIER